MSSSLSDAQRSRYWSLHIGQPAPSSSTITAMAASGPAGRGDLREMADLVGDRVGQVDAHHRSEFTGVDRQQHQRFLWDEAQYRRECRDHCAGPVEFTVTLFLGHGHDAGNFHRQPVVGAAAQPPCCASTRNWGQHVAPSQCSRVRSPTRRTAANATGKPVRRRASTRRRRNSAARHPVRPPAPARRGRRCARRTATSRTGSPRSRRRAIRRSPR